MLKCFYNYMLSFFSIL